MSISSGDVVESRAWLWSRGAYQKQFLSGEVPVETRAGLSGCRHSRIGVESEEIGGMGWQAQIIGTGAQERKSGSLAR